MAFYQRRNLQTHADIGEPGPLPANLQGLTDASLADLSAALDPAACEALGYTHQGFLPVADPEPEPLRERWVSKAVFKLMLTRDERLAIRAAAKADADVEDADDILMSSDRVDLDSDALIAGLALLVAKGLLTAQRAAELRA